MFLDELHFLDNYQNMDFSESTNVVFEAIQQAHLKYNVQKYNY